MYLRRVYIVLSVLRGVLVRNPRSPLLFQVLCGVLERFPDKVRELNLRGNAITNEGVARLQEMCTSGMLHLTPEAAVGGAGRSTPHVGKPVELEAGVLTQRGHAPAAAKEPREAADRRDLVGAAHGPPLGASSLPSQQAEQVVNFRRCLAPRAKHKAAHSAVGQEFTCHQPIFPWRGAAEMVFQLLTENDAGSLWNYVNKEVLDPSCNTF